MTRNRKHVTKPTSEGNIGMDDGWECESAFLWEMPCPPLPWDIVLHGYCGWAFNGDGFDGFERHPCLAS